MPGQVTDGERRGGAGWGGAGQLVGREEWDKEWAGSAKEDEDEGNKEEDKGEEDYEQQWG